MNFIPIYNLKLYETVFEAALIFIWAMFGNSMGEKWNSTVTDVINIREKKIRMFYIKK
jgi:hypothetical protein